MSIPAHLTIIGILWLSLAGPTSAEDSVPPKELDDPLLDKLVGDWNVDRKFGSGRTAKNVLHVEWVLQHQFVELHYRDIAKPPKYEAIVLIGYDHPAKHYICHWTDSTGADHSADGFASPDEADNVLEFKFKFQEGGALTNRFAFNPQSGTWTSTIRQTENGEWKLFCEDKFSRVAAK